jgi:hypothetical protein
MAQQAGTSAGGPVGTPPGAQSVAALVNNGNIGLRVSGTGVPPRIVQPGDSAVVAVPAGTQLNCDFVSGTQQGTPLNASLAYTIGVLT